MVTPTIDLAELFRHIQEINFNLESASMETKMELDFYKTVFSAFMESLDSSLFQTLIPVHFKVCTLHKAKEYASLIGIRIVEGLSDVYICFSKGLEL